MKQLMLTNQAVARGAYEAGVKVVSSYPGTPSTEITEFIAKYDEIYSEWAPNEKVAVEVAVGASFAGVRSMACMKHVGVNVAADPLFTKTNRTAAFMRGARTFRCWNLPTAEKRKNTSSVPTKFRKPTIRP